MSVGHKTGVQEKSQGHPRAELRRPKKAFAKVCEFASKIPVEGITWPFAWREGLCSLALLEGKAGGFHWEDRGGGKTKDLDIPDR